MSAKDIFYGSSHGVLQVQTFLTFPQTLLVSAFIFLSLKAIDSTQLQNNRHWFDERNKIQILIEWTTPTGVQHGQRVITWTTSEAKSVRKRNTVTAATGELPFLPKFMVRVQKWSKFRVNLTSPFLCVTEHFTNSNSDLDDPWLPHDEWTVKCDKRTTSNARFFQRITKTDSRHTWKYTRTFSCWQRVEEWVTRMQTDINNEKFQTESQI